LMEAGVWELEQPSDKDGDWDARIGIPGPRQLQVVRGGKAGLSDTRLMQTRTRWYGEASDLQGDPGVGFRCVWALDSFLLPAEKSP